MYSDNVYKELAQAESETPAKKVVNTKTKWLTLATLVVFCVIVAVSRSSSSEKIPTGRSSPTGTSWDPREGTPKYAEVSFAVAEHELMLVFHKDEMDLWSIGDNENLYHFGRCIEQGPDGFKTYAIMPNSKKLVYVTKAKNTAFVVYDLTNCRTLLEKDIGQEIIGLEAGKRTILATTSTFDHVFSLDGSKTSKVTSLATKTAAATVSENGVIAYRNAQDKTVNLFKADTNKTLPSLCVDFDYRSIHITPSGANVVIYEENSKKLAVYEVSTKKKLAQADTASYGWVQTISPDARCICFLNQDVNRKETATIVFLDLNAASPGKANFVFKLDLGTDLRATLTFRKLSGVHHLQVLSDTGVLKLYKINEAEKKWDLLS